MNEYEVRELIRRELTNLGDAMRPGGSYGLSGYDPDYETNQVQVAATVSDTLSDEQMRAPLHTGELVPFEFHFHIDVSPANAVTGVIVSVPTASSGSFTIDGGEPHPLADFNTSVGRLAAGNHVIKGVVHVQ